MTRKLVLGEAATEQQIEVANQAADEALTLPDQARALKVEDSDTLAKANELFLCCHQLEKKISATFDPICKAANAAHKAATQAKADALKPVTEAKGIIKREMEGYNAVQEDIRRERERLAQEEERKKAETRQVERAAVLEQQGHAALAEQVLAAPIQVPQVSLPTVKEELAGSNFVPAWKYKVIDPKALLQAAVDGKISFTVKDADEEKTTGAVQISIEVGKLLGATKEMFNLPGIRAWTEQALRAAGR
ncbi:hypothetical protein M0Q28_05455 [Patescibacteria group bacterium]|jgi:hypothetical protein|nr:hypothetical protein [Patescibacteria group bacterium]